MTRPPVIEKRTSSGGIIFRLQAGSSTGGGSGIEVALVSVRNRKVWCIPKGMIDKGEDPPGAALREVQEETGLSGEILDRIGQISYWYHLKGEMVRIHKRVHFFLLKYIEGSTDNHDHEVDEARWFPLHEAAGQLTYKSEREIMIKAVGMIESRLGK